MKWLKLFKPAHLLRVYPESAPGEINIIGRRRIWYSFSSLLLLPGVVALLVFGLNLGIDFTGGTVAEVRQISVEEAEAAAESAGITNLDVRTTPDGLLLRHREEHETVFEEADQTINDHFRGELVAAGAEIMRFDVVGPSISRDIARNALIAVALMSLAVVLYVAWSFKNMPPPVPSITFGGMAIAALLHDSLFVLGAFAIFGRFFGIEVDAFFVTAILTVIGFSVHDTIVVFDRIRENLHRYPGKFPQLVNRSVNDVLVRSLNTSLTTMLVLMGLLLFSGESIRHFILALLLGMAAGTYSSIMVASPLLVSWQKFKAKRG